jgi:cytochrome c2
MMRQLAGLAIVGTLALEGAALNADSARGEHLFETLQCVQCHSINGKGGAVGPDLGRRIDRNFTPASLAATMWNHAPTMRSAMLYEGFRTHLVTTGLRFTR